MRAEREGFEAETLSRSDRTRTSVVLRDGRAVTIRSIRASDAAALGRFHEGLSEVSIRNRFFGVHPHLSPSEVHRFTNVDGRRRFALVALIHDRIVGIARYEAVGTGAAEVALVVSDDHQRLGLGTQLLALLASRALTEGYSRLVAHVLAGNFEMLGVFAHSGLPVEFSRCGDEVDVSLALGSARGASDPDLE